MRKYDLVLGLRIVHMLTLSFTPYLLHGTRVGFVGHEGNETRGILEGGTTTPFTHFF